jgi:hypothetical protein
MADPGNCEMRSGEGQKTMGACAGMTVFCVTGMRRP